MQQPSGARCIRRNCYFAAEFARARIRPEIVELDSYVVRLVPSQARGAVLESEVGSLPESLTREEFRRQLEDAIGLTDRHGAATPQGLAARALYATRCRR